MDIIELILKWLKPEVSFIIGETDQKLNQVIEKFSAKTLRVTTSYPVEINKIDLIYTKSVIDINLYPLQNDGFVLATSSMLSKVKHDSRYEYVTFGEILIIKRTNCQVEWLPSYLGVVSIPGKGKEIKPYTPIYLRNLPLVLL